MDYGIVSKNRSTIMGFAALWIFYFHTAPMIFQNVHIVNNIEWYLKRAGYTGVDIFMLLSSYGLYYYFSKRDRIDLIDYFKSRLKRILPGYILALAVYTFIFGEGFRFFIDRLFFISQFSNNMYNFLWFVPCILVFYIFSPLYYSIFKRIDNKLLLTILISFIVCFLCRKYGYMVREDLYCIISRIPVFALGFYLGYISKKEYKINAWGIVLAAAFVIFGIGVNYALNKGYKELYLPYENCFINIFTAWGICVLISVICETFSNSFALGFIKKIFMFYGSISFEFYCFQEMIDKYIKSSFIGEYMIMGRRYMIIIFIAVFILSTLAALLVSKIESTALAKLEKES